jgi:hypothetical protein
MRCSSGKQFIARSRCRTFNRIACEARDVSSSLSTLIIHPRLVVLMSTLSIPPDRQCDEPGKACRRYRNPEPCFALRCLGFPGRTKITGEIIIEFCHVLASPLALPWAQFDDFAPPPPSNPRIAAAACWYFGISSSMRANSSRACGTNANRSACGSRAIRANNALISPVISSACFSISRARASCSEAFKVSP